MDLPLRPPRGNDGKVPRGSGSCRPRSRRSEAVACQSEYAATRHRYWSYHPGSKRRQRGRSLILIDSKMPPFIQVPWIKDDHCVLGRPPFSESPREAQKPCSKTHPAFQCDSSDLRPGDDFLARSRSIGPQGSRQSEYQDRTSPLGMPNWPTPKQRDQHALTPYRSRCLS